LNRQAHAQKLYMSASVVQRPQNKIVCAGQRRETFFSPFFLRLDVHRRFESSPRNIFPEAQLVEQTPRLERKQLFLLEKEAHTDELLDKLAYCMFTLGTCVYVWCLMKHTAHNTCLIKHTARNTCLI